jgi:hypothetical protein
VGTVCEWIRGPNGETQAAVWAPPVIEAQKEIGNGCRNNEERGNGHGFLVPKTQDKQDAYGSQKDRLGILSELVGVISHRSALLSGRNYSLFTITDSFI